MVTGQIDTCISKNQCLESSCNYYFYKRISYTCSFVVIVILAFPLFLFFVFFGHTHEKFFFWGGGESSCSLMAPRPLHELMVKLPMIKSYHLSFTSSKSKKHILSQKKS